MHTVVDSLRFVQGTVPPEPEGTTPSTKYIRTDEILYDGWVYSNTIDIQMTESRARMLTLYQYYIDEESATPTSGDRNPYTFTPAYVSEYNKQSNKYRCRVHFRNGNDISTEDLSEATTTIVYAAIWYIQNGKITNNDMATRIDDPYMQPPYPPNFWFIDEDKITHSQIPETIYQGSFCNCTNLKTVIIPASVKYIGEYAFYNTALTAVTIARDCTFFPTSFPPRCTINYYLE